MTQREILQQKSVNLVLVFAASCVSILLSLLEAVCVLRSKLRQADGAAALQAGARGGGASRASCWACDTPVLGSEVLTGNNKRGRKEANVMSNTS